jgi:hypothetical protein
MWMHAFYVPSLKCGRDEKFNSYEIEEAAVERVCFDDYPENTL